MLAYIRKLTLTPSKMASEDAASVFAAGWDDRALHDAVSICALFNLMNRLVQGLGIEADADYVRKSSDRLAEEGYAGLIRLLS